VHLSIRRSSRRGPALAIDNEMYDRMGQTWWDEDNPLNMLHGSVTPARFGYFLDVLRRLNIDPAGRRVLDVGCGGGFVAEEFARLGCAVVGVDPSPVSIETAQRHAAASGHDIEYVVAPGERLPFPDAAFDLAYCCDVLEHVRDLDQVVGETARVLRPGGRYLFDTVNRTLASKLLAIKVLQEWRLTRVFDTPGHVWDMFITPDELRNILDRHGLLLGEIVGLAPRAKNPLVLLDFARARRGRLSYGELSRRLNFGQVSSTRMSYMGFATKAGGSATSPPG
jgi:2-polyprenyl-6-hydroxyphenyl methylase / 3-demethylubiquinone-9 3-methyltransferase